MLKPTLLKKGDLVAVAAPGSPFDRERFRKGTSLLKKKFKLVWTKNIFSRENYLAGNDRRRAAELNRFLKDPKIKALLFARGGYGCQRLLPFLKGSVSPKVVIGSSDLTAILNYLWKKFRLVTFYGPMVAPHFTNPKNVARLTELLTDPNYLSKQKLPAKKILHPGKAQGTLVGGCLSLIVAGLGTPWEMETEGKLLFLEDINEEPYKIDRLLTQLEQAGKFRGVKGIVFGTFKMGEDLFPAAIESVIREKLKNFKRPILWGMNFGHCKDPLFIPFGGQGKIVGKRLVITRGIF
jgi:muramoyltetrapeptide carboxypeptidase